MRWRAPLAEAIGVFALVFAGAGAVMVDARTGALGPVGVAATFGIVIAVMVHAMSRISGAHLNPAITVGFAAARRFPWRRVPDYLGAQMLGAVAAATLLRIVLGPADGLGATTLVADLGPVAGLVVEGVATFLLALVIAAVADGYTIPQGPGALTIGMTVGLGALFAGPLTGGSMNPARSLGPALVGGVVTHQWIYVAGPLVGGVLGFGTWTLLEPAADPLPPPTPEERPTEDPVRGE